MTGFVDPEFSRLKPTEPKFLIWKVSKKEEDNYQVKPIKRELYGEFHDRESYIVYCASHSRTLSLNHGKGSNQKLEIHIHFWLGSKLTDDEHRRTIIKATELDDVLDGFTVVHKETEGNESNRFLSYFKTAMKISQGEMNAATFHRSRKEPDVKLYRLTDKATTMVLTEQPSVSWDHFRSNGVFLLETANKIFVWIGRHASKYDIYAAHKFGKRMENSGSEKSSVLLLDGAEKALDLPDFEMHLPMSVKSVVSELGNPEDDQSTATGGIKLYQLTRMDDINAIVHMKDGPLVQSDLNAKSMYIVDGDRHGIWVWVGRKVAEEDRSRAINIGIAYSDRKRKSGDRWGTPVARVVEGAESNEFKLLFKDWIQSFVVTGRDYFAKKPTKPVNASFTADRLEASPFLAADTQLLDYGSGMMKVFRVNGDQLDPISPAAFGIFYSGCTYLVHYVYAVKGGSKSVLYCWVGANAPQRDRETTIWPSLMDVPELKDAAVLVRVRQFKETPHFHAIFQGKMIVLNGTSLDRSESSGDTDPLDRYPNLLLRVEGGDVINTRSVEVEAKASSLSTRGVFLLRSPESSYLWCGLSSKGDEREIGKLIANMWAPGYRVLLEGHETEEFWRMLGGRAAFTGKEEVIEVPINVPPRLFKCVPSKNGFSASEVINFTQSDLCCNDIAILDPGTPIFVWSGSAVSEEERRSTERMTQQFLVSDPRRRDLDIPIIHVRQGLEPPIFTGFFAEWHKAHIYEGCDTINREMSILKEQKSSDCSDKEEPSCLIKQKYPVEELRRKPVEDLPPDVDPLRREDYITDEEFLEVFGLPRSSFESLPQWRRKNLKISAGLF